MIAGYGNTRVGRLSDRETFLGDHTGFDSCRNENREMTYSSSAQTNTLICSARQLAPSLIGTEVKTQIDDYIAIWYRWCVGVQNCAGSTEVLALCQTMHWLTRQTQIDVSHTTGTIFPTTEEFIESLSSDTNHVCAVLLYPVSLVCIGKICLWHRVKCEALYCFLLPKILGLGQPVASVGITE